MKSRAKKKAPAQREVANFLYEIGTLRKLMRVHRQVLLTDDMSDSIASHSYRVTMIGWFLAKHEGADPYKTVMMCLLHDIGEARSNDHNWVHKKYIKVYEDEITRDQLTSLPYGEMFDIAAEYHERKSIESVLAKEADILDQILLLREYEWAGNKEAARWLYGSGKVKKYVQLDKLKTDVGREFGTLLYEVDPSEWWSAIWTSKNR